MHREVKIFIKEVRKELPYKFRLKTVLEVGSHNINGSPRKYFWFCKYYGIDIYEGKGVDFACNISEFNMNANVVISTEMLEHDKNWKESLKKMYNLLDDKGLLVITCAGPDRKEHGTIDTSPEDSPNTQMYYDNISIEDFEEVLPQNLFDLYVLQYARGKNDLQFYGIKKINNRTSKEIYKALRNVEKFEHS